MLIEHFIPSGIGAELMARLCIELVPARQDRQVKLPVPSARIPYFDLDGKPTGFYRLRTLKPWVPKGEEKERRYVQATGSGNHLYLPPVGAQTWRDVATTVGIPLLITEGEKKAACATAHGFSTIGLGGVWSWRGDRQPLPGLDQFHWQGRNVCLAFDSPDVQVNRGVAEALIALADELRGRGAVVKFIHFPADGGKVGLDDFLVDHGPKQLQALIDAATEEPVDVVAELNRDIAMVWNGGKALVLREERDSTGVAAVAFARPNEVEPGYANRLVRVHTANGSKMVNAFSIWKSSPSRREYRGVVFAPGSDAPGFYNLFQGFAVKPVKGDCRLFLQHVEKIICAGNAELAAYVLSWMAHAVQKPGELPGTALVLRGKMGIGKSVFCKHFGSLFGAHFVMVSQQSHLVGSFNRHLERALCVLSEEGFWAGDKAAEGALKALITEPTRMIEGKGRDAISVANFTRLLVSTNNAWAVPAGLEERRMVIMDVSDARMQDEQYFGRLLVEMSNGGREALMQFLLDRDIRAFNPRVIPKTMALLDNKLHSLIGARKFLFEMLATGVNNRQRGGWAAEVPTLHLHEMYRDFSNGTGERHRSSETELGRVLHDLLPKLTAYRPRIGVGGQQVRLWKFPSLDECRKAFESAIGQPIDWKRWAAER
ncbi:DUF5906 domain-containing protein [Pelomonas sp. SE-A7]|uniref:DUF5906 domain-containing protein n=1 Tax=Pelomonas sp. SE-A7 TaxID=3054953 RepID=UPI00259D0E08|nr:DUF5906 domain-containing protein [Pelomonas sp. SE-A7]MDM4767278.1 DUF3854 domain-containing protein [Pelomonas sp. SE-A7]